MMAFPGKAPRPVLPAAGDPIRIVPLHLPVELMAPTKEAGPLPAPQLTYRGGPLLANVKVFTIFWGAAWQKSPQLDLAKNLNQFFDFVLTSSLIDQLAEYDTPHYSIKHGKHIGSATIAHPISGHHVTDNGIRHFLQQELSTNPSLPAPDANTIYFIYTAPGVQVVQGGARSCQAFCGYHDAINSQIFYAAMPYAGCSGCTGGLSVLDAMTSTSSHELCEAITDAVPGQGWYDDANGEIGDICAWTTKKVGAYTVQLEWSNKANKCI
jgi:hypothetical protein